MNESDLRLFESVTSLIRRKYKLAAQTHLANSAQKLSQCFADIRRDTDGAVIVWITDAFTNEWTCVMTTRAVIVRGEEYGFTELTYEQVADWRPSEPFGADGGQISISATDGREIVVRNLDYDTISVCSAVLMRGTALARRKASEV